MKERSRWKRKTDFHNRTGPLKPVGLAKLELENSTTRHFTGVFLLRTSSFPFRAEEARRRILLLLLLLAGAGTTNSVCHSFAQNEANERSLYK